MLHELLLGTVGHGRYVDQHIRVETWDVRTKLFLVMSDESEFLYFGGSDTY